MYDFNWLSNKMFDFNWLFSFFPHWTNQKATMAGRWFRDSSTRTKVRHVVAPTLIHAQNWLITQKQILTFLGAAVAFLSVGFLARRLLFAKKPKKRKAIRKTRPLLSRVATKAMKKMHPKSKSVLIWFLTLLDKVCTCYQQWTNSERISSSLVKPQVQQFREINKMSRANLSLCVAQRWVQGTMQLFLCVLRCKYVSDIRA